jgi:predicted PurR-regulated permease PerM
MVVAEMLLVGVPILLAAPMKAEDIEGLRRAVEGFVNDGLPELGDKLAGIPMVGQFLQERWSALQLDISPLTNMLRPYAGMIAQNLLGLLLAVLSGLVEFVVAILLAFFFYRDGPAMARVMEGLAQRIAGRR